MKTKLDRYERGIENKIDSYIPLSPDEKKRILKKAAKTRTISLRLNELVLEKIKHKAEEEGIFYQTLISSILYKYSTSSLLDKNAVRSVVSALKNKL